MHVVGGGAEFGPARNVDHGRDLRPMAGRADLERALITGVGAVVLVLLGGTTWWSDGFWAPDGAYSLLVSPIISLVWIAVVSRILLTRSPATRAGWLRRRPSALRGGSASGGSPSY